MIRWRAIGHRQRRCKGRVRGYTSIYKVNDVNVVNMLWVQKLSEVERRQNRQKLGCVPFLCGKNPLPLGQVP